LANFITIARKVISGRPGNTTDNTSSKMVLQRKGKRIIVSRGDMNSIYRSQQKRFIRIEYSGPTKINCGFCGAPFLFTADGKGRRPEYHSNGCKQKAYRERKKSISN